MSLGILWLSWGTVKSKLTKFLKSQEENSYKLSDIKHYLAVALSISKTTDAECKCIHRSFSERGSVAVFCNKTVGICFLDPCQM